MTWGAAGAAAGSFRLRSGQGSQRAFGGFGLTKSFDYWNSSTATEGAAVSARRASNGGRIAASRLLLSPSGGV